MAKKPSVLDVTYCSFFFLFFFFRGWGDGLYAYQLCVQYFDSGGTVNKQMVFLIGVLQYVFMREET